jgi:phosphatidylglycerol:prolipoprotein diacylglycerol transferase
MNIDPVCFHLGSRPIYWYGVMMALGFLASLGHWRLLSRRTGVDTAFTGDLLVWLMVAGIGGARVAYVLANLAYFRAAPSEIFRVDQGGLIFYGGFLGAGVALVIFSRLYRLSLAAVTDLVVTALPLGHAFGRVGCFLNGCCGGRAAPAGSAAACNLSHYPVQLYEAAFNLAVYALLFWFFLAPARRRPGRVLVLYLMCYPAGRFLLEYLRGDERTRVGAFDIAQWVSLALMATGLTFWILLRRHEHAHRSA